jgi:hypothetical protein
LPFSFKTTGSLKLLGRRKKRMVASQETGR